MQKELISPLSKKNNNNNKQVTWANWIFVTKKDKEGKPNGLIYVYLYESDEKKMPNLDKAEDGHEHSDCGFFTLEDLPVEKNEELYKILTKILS